MQTHPCLSYLCGEADALDLEAARVEAALRHGVDLPGAAREALQRGHDRVERMAGIEAQTLGAVIAEHVARVNGTPLQAEWEALRQGWIRCRRIEDDLQAGADCREDLEAYAQHLHAAAAIGRDELLPWARQELGDVLLREADARLAAYARAEPDVGVDWDALPT